MKQKGPWRTSRLWSERAGDPTWEPSRLPGPEWVGQVPSAPSLAPLVLEGPSYLPLLFCPGLPPMSPGPMQPGGGLWGYRIWPRAGQTSPADWAGEILGMLPPDPSPRGSLQVWEHLPPLSHPSAAPVLSGLHFSSPLSPPTSYWFTWGFLPSPWALRSPPASGRCPSWGETRTLCLPTPPSWLRHPLLTNFTLHHPAIRHIYTHNVMKA